MLKRWLRKWVYGLVQRNRNAVLQGLPIIELESKHIKNLRVLTNRVELLKQLPKGGVVAEIGVDEGDYSALILEHCEPELLYLIDPWDSVRYGEEKYRAVRERFAEEIERGQVKIIRKRSGEALRELEPGSLDWVYIDSDHSYATTRMELELAHKLVKEGGIICGHDYCNSSWGTGQKYGVVEAVNEFVVTHNYEMVFLTMETKRSVSYGLRADDNE